MGNKPEDGSMFAILSQANARARATGRQAEAMAFQNGVIHAAKLLRAMSHMFVSHVQKEDLPSGAAEEFAESLLALREAAGTVMGAAAVQAAATVVDDVFNGLRRYTETAEDRERNLASDNEASEIRPEEFEAADEAVQLDETLIAEQ